ncbi:hypothetical protein M3Y99_01429400 [Aphelenchoides fujianensis]|nr:hypothetical protein M3Y99_01429400 [Aphelenchoides fujianensis]
MRTKIKHLELKQQSDQTEKRLVTRNFHRLLITARSEIAGLKEEIRRLHQRLEGWSAVTCPQCSHEFRSGDSRLLPKYVRYVKAAHRLELEFADDPALRQWLLCSNLDTDKEGIPVIPAVKTTPETLKDVGSALVNPPAQPKESRPPQQRPAREQRRKDRKEEESPSSSGRPQRSERRREHSTSRREYRRSRSRRRDHRSSRR